MGILGNPNKELFGNNQFATMWNLCLVEIKKSKWWSQGGFFCLIEVKNPHGGLKANFLIG